MSSLSDCDSISKLTTVEDEIEHTVMFEQKLATLVTSSLFDRLQVYKYNYKNFILHEINFNINLINSHL